MVSCVCWLFAYLLLEKCLFNSFAIFNQVVCFLFLTYSSLYILSINPLADIICKYFLLFCRLTFHCADCVLWWTEVLNIEGVQFAYFQFLFYISNLSSVTCILSLQIVIKGFRKSTKNGVLAYAYLICLLIQFWFCFLMVTIVSFGALARGQSVLLPSWAAD